MAIIYPGICYAICKKVIDNDYVATTQFVELYGLKIEGEFSKLYNFDLTINSLYSNLDWLEKNEFISSWGVEEVVEWGGKRWRCYALIDKGKQEEEK